MYRQFWSLCGKYAADSYLLGVITLRQETPACNVAVAAKEIAVFTNDGVMIARSRCEFKGTAGYAILLAQQ